MVWVCCVLFDQIADGAEIFTRLARVRLEHWPRLSSRNSYHDPHDLPRMGMFTAAFELAPALGALQFEVIVLGRVKNWMPAFP